MSQSTRPVTCSKATKKHIRQAYLPQLALVLTVGTLVLFAYPLLTILDSISAFHANRATIPFIGLGGFVLVLVTVNVVVWSFWGTAICCSWSVLLRGQDVQSVLFIVLNYDKVPAQLATMERIAEFMINAEEVLSDTHVDINLFQKVCVRNWKAHLEKRYPDLTFSRTLSNLAGIS